MNLNLLEFDTEKHAYVENGKLYWNNGKYLGDIVEDVDGTFLYFPDKDNGGGWGELGMLVISAILYKMNKPMYDEWEAYFNAEDEPGN